MRRVVAGPDGIHPGPLHADQVGPGVIKIEDPAADRMGLVPVHPPEHHPRAVDQESVAGDPHRPKAHPQGHRLPGRSDLYVVEPGLLSTPGLDVAHREGADLARVGEFLGHAQFGNLDRHRVRGLGRDDLGSDRALAVGVVRGAQPDVVHAAGRPGEQGHVAEDARQPPLILIFEVAHRRPLVHPDHDQVAAGPEGVGDVELLHQPAALADTDLGAVQPHPIDRFDAVEPQQRAFRRPSPDARRCADSRPSGCRRARAAGRSGTGTARWCRSAGRTGRRRSAPSATAPRWCPSRRRRSSGSAAASSSPARLGDQRNRHSPFRLSCGASETSQARGRTRSPWPGARSST